MNILIYKLYCRVASPISHIGHMMAAPKCCVSDLLMIMVRGHRGSFDPGQLAMGPLRVKYIISFYELVV